MNKNKGFTLIELLVVIAIIGILSSVVLASLSSARDKGKDAAVKSQLAGMKAQAELFYATGETYVGLCAASQATNGFGGTAGPGLLRAAHDSSGTSALNDILINPASGASITNFTTVCNDTADSWAAMVSLSTSNTTTPTVYCVDNTGLSKETNTKLGIGDWICD